MKQTEYKEFAKLESELKVKIKKALIESVEDGDNFIWTPEIDKVAKECAHNMLQQAIYDFKNATYKNHQLVIK